ncbi:zinc finger MYM-type protein 1-like [Acyrthosiphon pisum]|uniref:DUF4371 domain-containing protein n=1 Tax=Acyrthosiphon pisum TaxID=7029 RepID=A0A8R1WXT7_ACYPI|nr:zinc finger MYM-type protein 1-like [Acyrthosiphon pisum]|eukprot:XP_008178672.1 PREDICTED: zinc finger MYM-type protein 1-like [Acyrthosiphon pisum]
MISADHARLISENRRYMKSIILSVRMLAIQGSAFRGHRENEESLNRGNFIDVMNLIASFDDTVYKKLNGPKNARYLHHSIQTEVVHIMANKMVLNKISYEINFVSCFSIMADETKDITNTEQLSIVIRYYYQDEIKERFLGFTPLKKLDANSLFLHIKNLLCNCKIDINKCVAQTYDGANVMKGHISDVQALFRKEVPYAHYIHCNNHRLNLVLVDVAKNVEEADKFFSLLQDIYVFMSGSTIHNQFIELQKKSWEIALKSVLDIDLLLLNNIVLEKTDRSSEAVGLLIHIVSKYLQDVNADISRAIILIQATKDSFDNRRNYEISHHNLYEEVEKKAISLNRMISEIDKRFMANEYFLSGITALYPESTHF